MTTLTTSQAASLFGVDAATIRRRIRSGALDARKGAGGRYLIALRDDAAYVAYLNDLLAEVRRQRNELERQIEAQRRELEHGGNERAELEELVISLRRPTLGAIQRGGSVPQLAGPESKGALQPQAVAAAVGWGAVEQRGDKKDLGASLVLTGVVAIGAGLLFHLALRTHAIDSAVHLGYLVGLVGLLLLLIGLLVVY